MASLLDTIREGLLGLNTRDIDRQSSQISPQNISVNKNMMSLMSSIAEPNRIVGDISYKPDQITAQPDILGNVTPDTYSDADLMTDQYKFGMGRTTPLAIGIGSNDLIKRVAEKNPEKLDEVVKTNALETQKQVQNLSPEEKTNFFSDLINDPERMSWLALGFNSMRLDPDENLAAALRERLKTISEAKATEKSRQGLINSEVLQKSYPQVYELVKNGQIKLKDAISLVESKQLGNIQVGSIPQDYQIVKTEDGQGWKMQVIEGSPTAKKLEEQETKTGMKFASQVDQTDMNINFINQAIDLISTSPSATGVKGAIVREKFGVLGAGSDAQQLGAFISQIKSNIGFDRLQRMREESPTGGALGQVAVQELEALQSTLGSLNLNQRPEVLIATLEDIKDRYTKNINRLAQNYDQATLNKYGYGYLRSTYDPSNPNQSSTKGDPLNLR